MAKLRVSFEKDDPTPTEAALDPVHMLRRIDSLSHSIKTLKVLMGILAPALGIVLGHLVVSWMSARDVSRAPIVNSTAERTFVDRASRADAGRP